MFRGTRTRKTYVIAALKILIFLFITVLLAGVLFLGIAFVIARGPSGAASERLVATLVESGSPFAGVFFTRDEMKAAAFYLPPAEVPSDVIIASSGVEVAVADISGDGWRGCVVTGLNPSRMKFTSRLSGVAGSDISLGLDGTVDAVLYDGCLSYVGDGEIYCVCAVSDDGLLHIGGMTAYTIANSGYTWAISADRVLVENGVPVTGIGGGYAARAAIGQRADGSVILISTQKTKIYPSGITYDELASLMYEYGAVTAAALQPEGGMRVGDDVVAGNRMTPGFSLIYAEGGES